MNESRVVKIFNLTLNSIQSDWINRQVVQMGVPRTTIIKLLINDAIKRERDDER